MHRKKLLELLHNHKGADAGESAMKEQMTAFVQNNDQCFDRELLMGHVTGSAWILDDSGQFVLLMHHRKLDKWFQPGGHCDGDNDVLRVALKEAQEETGLNAIDILSNEIFDIDIHPIPERKGIPAHLHYDVRFLFSADKTLPLLVNEESNGLQWVELASVESLNDSESMMRMVRKTLRAL